jgi:hypothetical protein
MDIAPAPSRTLTSLAQDIRREIEQADASLRDAVTYAIRAGELLIEAKGELKHGDWLPWLGANCRLGEREARNYMRLARNRQTVADLPTIREAVALLAAPKPAREKSEPETPRHADPSRFRQAPSTVLRALECLLVDYDKRESIADLVTRAAAEDEALALALEAEIASSNDVDRLRAIIAKADGRHDAWRVLKEHFGAWPAVIIEEAARLAGVSVDLVEQAIRLKVANPALAAAVLRGYLTLDQAEAVLKGGDPG